MGFLKEYFLPHKELLGIINGVSDTERSTKKLLSNLLIRFRQISQNSKCNFLSSPELFFKLHVQYNNKRGGGGKKMLTAR